MWTSGKESICNSHNTIQYWAKEVKKKLKKSIKEDNLSMLEDVLPVIDDIIKESRLAKKKGQNMENRLKRYRNSVESLGFKRVGTK